MALFDTARELYLVAKDDAALSAQIRAERASLATSIATDGETAFELTSATVNGQSFSGSRSMTKAQRLRMLGITVKMLDEQAAFQTGAIADFGEHGN